MVSSFHLSSFRQLNQWGHPFFLIFLLKLFLLKGFWGFSEIHESFLFGSFLLCLFYFWFLCIFIVCFFFLLCSRFLCNQVLDLSFCWILGERAGDLASWNLFFLIFCFSLYFVLHFLSSFFYFFSSIFLFCSWILSGLHFSNSISVGFLRAIRGSCESFFLIFFFAYLFCFWFSSFLF